MKQTDIDDLKKGIATDMRRIREDLAEQERLPGAYCQEYNTFKTIYRFVERRLRRVDNNACIILFSIMDRNGDLPSLHKREIQMEILGGVIQRSLRAGDVFTKYSSAQYLVMVMDSDEENAHCIAERVADTFEQKLAGDDNHILLHHCYPMQGVDVPTP